MEERIPIGKKNMSEIKAKIDAKTISENIRAKVIKEMPNDEWFKKATQTKEDYIEEMEEYCWRFNLEYGPDAIKRNQRLCEKGEIGINICETICILAQTYESITGIDLDWFVNEVEKKYSRRMQTEDKALQYGVLVQALVVFGSSKKQAIDAVSDWLCISNTTVRDAFYLNLKLEYGPTLKTELRGTLVETMFDTKFSTKPFPLDHPKASKAFVKVGSKYFNEYVEGKCILSFDELKTYFTKEKPHHYINEHFKHFEFLISPTLEGAQF